MASDILTVVIFILVLASWLKPIIASAHLAATLSKFFVPPV